MPPRTRRPRGDGSAAGRALDRALTRIRSLGCNLVQTNCREGISLDDIRQAENDVAVIVSKADQEQTAGLWVAIGIEGDGIAGLHALYGLTLRGSSSSKNPSISQDFRDRFAALRSRLVEELANLPCDDGINAPRSFILRVCRTLLRTHTLRCYSRLLADAAPPVKERPSRRTTQAALDVLEEVVKVLTCIDEVVHLDEDAPADATASAFAEDAAANEAQRQQLVTELAKELAESGVLEHWAHLALHVSAFEGAVNELAELLWKLGNTLESLDFGCGSQISAQLDMLDRPCLQHLLATHVTQLCAALDGDSTYTRTPAAHPLPLFSSKGLRIRQSRGAPEGPDTRLAQWALSVWRSSVKFDPKATRQLARTTLRALESLAASDMDPNLQAIYAGKHRYIQQLCVPPYSSGTTHELCMRLARSAVAAWRVPDAARERSRQLLMPHGEAPAVVLVALQCARAELLPAVAADEGADAKLVPVTRRVATRLEAWRRQSLDWLEEVLFPPPAVTWAPWSGSNILLPVHVPQLVKGLPPRPTLDVATALTAGYVRRHERLMRRLAQHPDRLACLVLMENGWDRAWAQMLAYGKPAELAANIATAAKLLRSGARTLPKPGGTQKAGAELEAQQHAVDRFTEVLDHAHLLVSPDHLELLLLPAEAAASGVAAGGGGTAAAAPAAGEAAGGSSGGSGGGGSGMPLDTGGPATSGPAPQQTDRASSAAEGVSGSSTGDTQRAVPAPLRQLGRLLSYTAVTLLPWVGASGRRLGELAMSGGCVDAEMPAAAVSAVLAWVPALLRAYRDAAAAGQQGTADAWRELLLVDLDLFALCGAAAALLMWPGGAASLAAAPAGSVAAVLLDDLRHALWALADGMPDGVRSLRATGGFVDVLQLLIRAGATGEEAALLRVLGQPGDGAPPAAGAAGAWAWRTVPPGAGLLVPPAEARAALPLCSNAACTNMAGDSEAALPLMRCNGRCGGGARYCCRRCQEEDWRAGHRAVCGAVGQGE